MWKNIFWDVHQTSVNQRAPEWMKIIQERNEQFVKIFAILYGLFVGTHASILQRFHTPRFNFCHRHLVPSNSQIFQKPTACQTEPLRFFRSEYLGIKQSHPLRQLTVGHTTQNQPIRSKIHHHRSLLKAFLRLSPRYTLLLGAVPLWGIRTTVDGIFFGSNSFSNWVIIIKVGIWSFLPRLPKIVWQRCLTERVRTSTGLDS